MRRSAAVEAIAEGEGDAVMIELGIEGLLLAELIDESGAPVDGEKDGAILDIEPGAGADVEGAEVTAAPLVAFALPGG